MKIQGKIWDLSEDGLGILRREEKPLYVPFAYPYDFVKARRVKRRFGRRIVTDFELLDPSPPLRQRPRCRHFGFCGGCLWQGGLKYKEQLRLKVELFEKITGISADIKGSPKVWGFRNVSNFIVSTTGIGLKKYGNPFDVEDLFECPVFSEKTLDYLRALRSFLAETGLKPWDLKRKTGDVHYLQVKEGKFTGEIMVNLISHSPPSPNTTEAFLGYFSFADSLYWSVKTDKRDDPRG